MFHSLALIMFLSLTEMVVIFLSRYYARAACWSYWVLVVQSMASAPGCCSQALRGGEAGDKGSVSGVTIFRRKTHARLLFRTCLFHCPCFLRAYIIFKQTWWKHSHLHFCERPPLRAVLCDLWIEGRFAVPGVHVHDCVYRKVGKSLAFGK